MHLVFATSIVPHGAPATGYEIANAAIIDALRRAGVRVTVLGFAWPGKPPADPDSTIVLGEVDVRTDTRLDVAEARLAGQGRRRRGDLLIREAAHRRPGAGAQRLARASAMSTAMC